MTRFFIERPVFAVVISVIILLAGVAAMNILPIAQYPEITPPTVQVSCSFPGANASVVQETVAAPIEQQVNGVEGMLYMSSQCTNDGGYNLTVTFKLGTNLDMAQVLVQNRVNLALPSLPDVVKATGVSTKKKSPAILLVVNLFSDRDPETNQPFHDQLALSNFATIRIKDKLARLDGVGDVTFLGQQDYSMRVWLAPDELASRDLTAGDVVNALKEQNVQVAAGQIGQQPVPRGQAFQYTLSAQGRLREAEEFGQIIIKAGAEGEIVRLKDIGRVELGAKNQDTRCRLDGKPSVGLAIYQTPGGNALQTADRLRAKMKELAEGFPRGLKYAIVYDTTPFIQESIHEVFKTLLDAIILVAIVVLFFLQDWKAMILPMIDVPVSLIGTFAIMYLLGFTLNNLTLFGLVLAIGIVVDDAIMVLENVERWMATGLDPKSATIKAMSEITGPIIAVTLVLCSVLLPSAFLGGISGQFYRQFALTISSAMVISAINAMTMTPSRAVMIFKQQKHGTEPGHHDREALPWWGTAILGGLLTWWLGEKILGLLGMDFGASGHDLEEAATPAHPEQLWAIRLGLALPGLVAGYFLFRPVNRSLAQIFKGFNRGFDWITLHYGRSVGKLLRLSTIVLVAYAGLVGLTFVGFTRVPTGFIPNQDKGYLLINAQLPDSSSLERTQLVMDELEKICRKTDGVAHTIAVPGQSFVLNAVSSNYGSMFVILKPFHDRHSSELHSDQIAQELRKQIFRKVEGAQVAVFGAPPVDGLGSAGGFKLMVQDLGEADLEVLQGQTANLADRGNRQPGLVGLFSSFRASTPQMYVDVDRTKCKSMGIPLGEVYTTLQVFLGGYYVNDFNRFGRTWQVNIQADAEFRLSAREIKEFQVRNNKKEMVSLGAVTEVRDSGGPAMITRYNMLTAAPINGATLPGVSTGSLIHTMNALGKKELPASLSYEWTELTYLQIQEGSSAIFAFIGAVVLVFLVLASQYESYTMPLSVILVVPMCLLSALFGIVLANMDLNIFVQVGLLVLVGLASKNAILIVEFARARELEGLGRFEATMESCRLRFRPIIMTSFAFILGVVPLMLSSGAGAEMRNTLGVAVFSGMIGVTIFGVFLTPVFYYVLSGWAGSAPGGRQATDSRDPTPAGPDPGRADKTDPLRG